MQGKVIFACVVCICCHSPLEYTFLIFFLLGTVNVQIATEITIYHLCSSTQLHFECRLVLKPKYMNRYIICAFMCLNLTKNVCLFSVVRHLKTIRK
jgi:hypothetical protein